MPEGIVEGKTLLYDRTIRAVTSEIDTDVVEVYDAKGAYLAPGFVDIHIHGSGGADTMDATEEALSTIARILPGTGTTAFVATTMTMSYERIVAALEAIRRYETKVGEATLLGAHLEGPFLNPTRSGAQDPSHIVPPDTHLVSSYADIVKLVTLAPEVEGAEAFVKTVRERFPHIVLSIGHSEASYAQASEAFAWGVRHVTHLFNAMSPYRHREPGIVGACFDDESTTCDIIADGVHLHSHHLRLIKRMKAEKTILITDAIRAGCMKAGRYDLGGRTVRVAESRAVLPDGTIAGSVVKMNEAVRRYRDETDATLCEAVYAASTAPAALLGLSRKGRIAIGCDADMVIFDEDLGIIRTVIGGECVYEE